MDDLGLEPTDRPAQQEIGPRVGRRPDPADQLGHHLDLQPELLGAVEEVPLRPLGRAGDQRDVVAEAMVQAVDGEQRVLLRRR